MTAAPAHARRPLHRTRWAFRHPVRTFRRNQQKSLNTSGFGLIQLTAIGGFTTGVLAWLAVTIGPLLTQ